MIIGIDASIWMYQATKALHYGTAQRGPNPVLRILYNKLVALLQLPVQFRIVFDGPERFDFKRGTRVLTRGHPLTRPFQELAGYFGYPCHTAPGEADAELGRLAMEGIIDVVETTDSDVFLFGAEKVIYTPNKKRDGKNVRLYTAEKILTTPGVGLTRGGILLVALLAGGDYSPGGPGCGPVISHAIARGGLGDQLLHHASQYPVCTPAFLAFLTIADTPEFPDPGVIFAYVHPVTSFSLHHNPPPHHSWGAASPNVKSIARFCQKMFAWDAATIASKFSTALFPGVALQSLLKPYDLHALLEAHLELGLSTDQDDFSRSSVIQVLKQKTNTHCGRSLLLYRVKISAGALSLCAKAGLADASAFVIPAAMTPWIPASIINYALPGLYSRSNRSTSSAKSKTSRQSQQRKSIRKAPPVASGSSRTLGKFYYNRGMLLTGKLQRCCRTLRSPSQHSPSRRS
ncbi:PIN domain-like protein [Favolaschia claudopus]|uniref:PIN domain-like protein n=1 Tax=Favolaschia claudopus TaxID=2862362 RepID=A0AAW0AGZ6_9AGAR